MATLFGSVYNRFLGKITDDMYMELTPEDTIKDLQNLLIDAIPGFEFPRIDLTDHKFNTCIVDADKILNDDFIYGAMWGDISDINKSQIPNFEEVSSLPQDLRFHVSWGEIPGLDDPDSPKVLVDRSYFSADLTSEEINILALLMKQSWVQRQVTSIEHTRMKYSGPDFKMTSQANHLQKLLNLLEESRRDSFHMQRLYKRRKLNKGLYQSNWSVLGENSALD